MFQILRLNNQSRDVANKNNGLSVRAHQRETDRMLNEFKAFIARGNVMDLAVGVIIGGAFGGIVKSLVDDIIMPIVGALVGGFDFSNYFFGLSSRGQRADACRGPRAGCCLRLWKFHHRDHQFPDPCLDHLPDDQGREVRCAGRSSATSKRQRRRRRRRPMSRSSRKSAICWPSVRRSDQGIAAPYFARLIYHENR